MNTRKVVAFLIALCLLVTLTACRSEQTPDDSNVPADGDTSKPTSTTTAAPEEPYIDFRDTSENGGTIGSWWWNSNQAKMAGTRDKYLEFLQNNQVTEIYLHAAGMSNDQMAEFIRAAASHGMRVAWLVGDASWINDCNTDCVTQYLTYQKQAAEDAKFYALHLDVEPHQLGNFGTEREAVMQLYAEYVQEVASQLHTADEKVEWDIPFWLESDVVTIDGKEMPLLDAIGSVSDTLCLMSYRDTATEVLAVSQEEFAVAKTYGCKVICGVETYSVEGDFVSFREEGKVEMYKQLKTVYSELGKEELTAYGVAIHHVPQWEKLQK